MLTMTCYHAVPSQCNDDCLTTASGAKIESTETAYSHRYIALSRDLLELIPYGSEVTIEGCSIEEYNGTWICADTMNKRYTETCDILINPDMKLTKEQIKLKYYGESGMD